MNSRDVQEIKEGLSSLQTTVSMQLRVSVHLLINGLLESGSLGGWSDPKQHWYYAQTLQDDGPVKRGMLPLFRALLENFYTGECDRYWLGKDLSFTGDPAEGDEFREWVTDEMLRLTGMRSDWTKDEGDEWSVSADNFLY